MANNSTLNYTNFYYDVQRQGYDTATWRTLAGTPAISSNTLVLNVSAIIHMADVVRGTYTFGLTIPRNAANLGTSQFGLYSISRGEYIVFKMNGARFTAETGAYVDGTLKTYSIPLVWDDSTLSSTNIEFTIRWEGGTAKFFVNGSQQGAITDGSVPFGPLALFVNNASADNLAIKFVNAKAVQSYLLNPAIEATTYPTGQFTAGDSVGSSDYSSVIMANLGNIGTNDASTVTDAPSISAALAGKAPFDASTITESVTVTVS